MNSGRTIGMILILAVCMFSSGFATMGVTPYWVNWVHSPYDYFELNVSNVTDFPGLVGNISNCTLEIFNGTTAINTTVLMSDIRWNDTIWSSNTSLVSGLVDVGSYSAPTIIYNFSGNEKWTLITGDNGGTLNGSQWNGTDWIKNVSITNGLGDVGQYSTPTITYNFADTATWTLITGETNGGFSGKQWNITNSIWVTNSTLVNGLGDIGARVLPVITYNFSSNNKWTLIAMDTTSYSYFGFQWNGTSWVSNSTIVNGLSYDTSYGFGIVYNFLNNGLWTFIGDDYGFWWNGTQWVLNFSLTTGLSVTAGQKNIIYNFSGNDEWALISGNTGGTFTSFQTTLVQSQSFKCQFNITDLKSSIGYSFRLFATNDSNYNYSFSNTQFNFTRMNEAGSYTLNKTYFFNNSLDSLFNYSIFYFYKANYSGGTNRPVLNHEQAPDNTYNDTGFLYSVRPQKSQYVYCGAFVGWFFDENTTLILDDLTNLNNIYYHTWWNATAGSVSSGIAKSQENFGGGSEIGVSTATAKQRLYSNEFSHWYNLASGVKQYSPPPFSGKYTYDYQDIYQFTYGVSGANPDVINTQNFSSFIIINIPDNATLNELDSDLDGLNDTKEIYIYFTDPFYNDTDNDGVNDLLDYYPNNPSASNNNVTTITQNYPNTGIFNVSSNISFGFTPVFYGGSPVNCSLYSNNSGTWGFSTANQSIVQNNTLNSIWFNVTGLNITWSIGCYGGGLMNYSDNRSLNVNHVSGGNSTMMVANYPDNNAKNYTVRNIEFGWTPTYLGGNIKNCSLYSNTSGAWGWTKANTTIVTNGTLNKLSNTFAGNIGTVVWSIGCWDETMENFTSNRTLTLMGNSTIMTPIAPPANLKNTTSRTIQFKFNATYLGGTPVNCSLYTNETSWSSKQLNQTPVYNKSIMNITYAFIGDGNYTWSISCWDQNSQNFTANRTLDISLTLNLTTLQVLSLGDIYAGDQRKLQTNVTDLSTNLTIGYGTMSFNYSKPDGTTANLNMTYNSSSLYWENSLYFDSAGIWLVNYTYFGGNLLLGAVNATQLPIAVVPSGGGGPGGGGTTPPVQNETNQTNQTIPGNETGLNKTIEIFIEGLDWVAIEDWVKGDTNNIPHSYLLAGGLFVTSYIVRKKPFISLTLIAIAIVLLVMYR